MDPEVLHSSAQPTTRRITRSSTKVVNVEPTARGPLKRTRRGAENKTPPTAVNGAKDTEDGMADDDESPSKKSKSEEGGGEDCSGDEMDVQDTDKDHRVEQHEDDEMDEEEDSHPFPSQAKRSSGKPLMRDVNGPRTVAVSSLGIADTRPYLGSRRTSHAGDQDPELQKTKRAELSRRSVVVSNKAATQLRQENQHRPQEDQHRLQESQREALTFRSCSMADYRKKMEADVNRTGVPRPDQRYHTSGVPYTTQHQGNSVLPPKPATQLRKQDKTKSAVKKKSSGSSIRGLVWCVWRLCKVLLVLVSSAVLGVMAYQNLLVLHAGDEGPARPTDPARFQAQLSVLQARFPGQRADVWRRSRIHLEKHLRTAQPTEPVSLILTAGRGAERTLRCLARQLASAFSSALNGSALHIDGASKAGQDSDRVKLDIDGQLRRAFEGDQPVAVIHRFEELPPSSAIIFYRYCDHENAAYKHVFLAFTVLLPQEQLGAELDLKEVEELVQDYVKDRFVGPDGSDGKASFNRMDLDKLSGLWSRISHLILPVAAEDSVEQGGCMD